MSYNYNQVYYYEHDCTDFSTTGECGDLMPAECLFEEQKNGLSRITMRLAYDPWGKWAYPKVGGYVKAAVPVRVPPQIVDGDYASTIARYESVSANVPVYMRQDENSPVSAMVKVGQTLYGKNIIPILDNFVQVSVKPWKTDDPSEKRIIGYYPKTKLRKIEEVGIAPASYGMESIKDLVTRLADQYFQIVEVTQGDEYVDVVAEHVFYELLTDYTSYKPDAQTEISGSTCVNQILANAYGNAGRFNISSSSSKTLKGLDFERKNVVEALLDPEKGACALYGMVLLRDNWDIYCLPEEDVGYDRGFVVEYGKNLASIKHTEDISQTITRIFPYGKTSKGEARFISSGTRYVDSTHINDYGAPRVMLLDTGLVIGKGGVTTSNIDAKLREAAQKEYDENKIDVPRLTMEIDFVSLGDTEEYAQFRGLDKVYLYDKIKIIDRFRGYLYSAEVVGVVHNVRTGVLEKVTLGSLDNTDASRKVAVWQVPEVDGSNIRLKSIGLGVLGDESVDSDAIIAGAISTLHLAAATIDDLTTVSFTAVQAQIEELIAGHVTAESIVAGAVTADAIEAGSVTAEKIDAGAVTTEKIAAGAITAESAIIARGAIGDAEINSAGINYAKIKDLNAQSAYFGHAIIEEAIGQKLFIPRLIFDAAQGRQMLVKDLVIGASNGLYYKLDITDSDGTISMSPTQVTVTAEEEEAGHTTDGKPIIGTTATYQDLTTTNLYAIDALIDQITAQRINVDELWARQAFINKLNVQDLSSNTYIRATVGNWDTTQGTIAEDVAGIHEEIGELSRGKVTFGPDAPDDPSVGDIWVKQYPGFTHEELEEFTHEELEQYTHAQLSGEAGVEIYVWDGTYWKETQEQENIRDMKAEFVVTKGEVRALAQTTELIGGEVQTHTAQISAMGDRIISEVQKGLNGQGGYSSVYQTENQVKTTIANEAYEKNTVVDISEDGVDIESTGHVYIGAGGSDVKIDDEGIVLGGGKKIVINQENLQVAEDGSMNATNVTVSGTIQRNGYDAITRENLIVQTEEPSTDYPSGTIWVKPTGGNTIVIYGYAYAVGALRQSLRLHPFTATMTGDPSQSPVNSGRYSATAMVYLSADVTNAHVTMQVTDGMNTVTLTTTVSGRNGQTIQAVFDEISSPTWLGDESELTFTLSSDTYDVNNARSSSGSINMVAFQATGVSGSTTKTWGPCEIHVLQ